MKSAIITLIDGIITDIENAILSKKQPYSRKRKFCTCDYIKLISVS